MSKDRLLALLKAWQNQLAFWEFKMQHAAWVDDGKGGCVDKKMAYMKAQSKVELLQQLISECK